MEKTFEEFKNQVEQLDKEIEVYYKNKGEFVSDDDEPYQKQILSDGIVNIEEYYDSPIKILWILKEPYDNVENGRWGWKLHEYLGSEKFYEKFKNKESKTQYPIIYTTYAILNQIKEYDHMDDIPDNPDMIRILKKIGYINLQKFPAKSKSNDNEIKSAYEKHKEILLRQIKLYNADIIIGGNTMWHLIEGLELKNCYQNDNGLDYWRKDGKIYIDAFHPSQWKIPKEEYINDILDVVNNNRDYLKK